MKDRILVLADFVDNGGSQAFVVPVILVVKDSVVDTFVQKGDPSSLPC